MAGLADFDAYAGLIPAEQIAGAKDRAIAAMLANFGAAMTGAGQQGLGLAGGFAQGALGASKAMDDARTGVVQEALLGGQLDQRRDEMAKRAALAKLAGDPRAGQMLGPLAPLMQFMTPDALAKLQQDQADRAAGMAAIGAMTGAPGLGGFSPTTPLVGPGAGGPPPASSPTPHPNSPGNMIDGRGGWQSFATPEDGVAATVANLASYPGKFNGGKPMTLQQIAMRWAPPDDGKTPLLRGNNPQAWADTVARVSGLPVDQPIDLNNPQVVERVIRGMHAIEKGPAAAYAPEVYARGVQRAFGGAPPAGSVPTQAPGVVPTQGDIPREVVMAAQLLASQGKGAQAAELIATARQKAIDTARAEAEFAYRRQQDALTRGDRLGEQGESLTTTLRNEITKSKPYQDWITVQPIFDSMKASAARQSKASDLDLVYGLAKLMDPGSVVREGEMIMVQRAGGPIEAIRGMIESVNGGASITPQVRAEIMQTAQQRVEAHHNAFQTLFEPIKGIAARRKIAVDDIAPGVGKYEPFDPKTIGQTPRQTAPGAPAPAPTQAPPVIEWERGPDGRLRQKGAP